MFWFAGSGILIFLGIFGLSVFSPDKGLKMSPQLSLLCDVCGLVFVAGLARLEHANLAFFCRERAKSDGATDTPRQNQKLT